MASYQVIIALLIRERTGIGQKVDISLLGTVSYLMYFNNLVALLSGIDVPRHEQANADPLRNYYRCKDDKWLILTDNPRFDNWEIICELLDCPELAKDPRFSTREGRMEYSREIVAVINNAFLNRSRDEWLKIFREKKIIMCSVNTSMEAIKDNQMIENKYIVDYDHPTMGKIKIPGFPIGFSESKINNNLSAPKLGEHTEMILSEISGLSKEEISRLKSENII